MVIVIGAEDRIKVETVNQELSAQIQQVYDRARTDNNGKSGTSSQSTVKRSWKRLSGYWL